MLEANLSIKEQVEVLEEAGISVSDKSYRNFLAREFGPVYDDFLKRNGWVRKKRSKETDDNG
jgi:transposase